LGFYSGDGGLHTSSAVTEEIDQRGDHKQGNEEVSGGIVARFSDGGRVFITSLFGRQIISSRFPGC
jgi:hypothetical protein